MILPRRIRRAPMAYGAVVASLGVAIGATIAIFAVVQALVLEALPVHRPDRLVRLALETPAGRPALVQPSGVGVRARPPGRTRGRRRCGLRPVQPQRPRRDPDGAGPLRERAVHGPARRAPRSGPAVHRGRRPARRRLRGGARSRLLDARVRRRPLGPRPRADPRRPDIHDRRRRAGGVLRRARRPLVRRGGAAGRRSDRPRPGVVARSAHVVECDGHRAAGRRPDDPRRPGPHGGVAAGAARGDATARGTAATPQRSTSMAGCTWSRPAPGSRSYAIAISGRCSCCWRWPSASSAWPV